MKTSIDNKINSLWFVKAFHKMLAVLGLLMNLIGCSTSDSTPTPPLTIPFALHQAGTVLETDVEIEQDDRVKFLLIFYVNDRPRDRDRLLTFLGGLGETGTPIPLKVKITKYDAPKETIILE